MGQRGHRLALGWLVLLGRVGGTSNNDLMTYFDDHQIFTDFQRATIVLARTRHEIVGRGCRQYYVRIESQPRFSLFEYFPSLLGSDVVSDNCFHALGRNTGTLKRLRRRDFVHQKINAFRRADEVVGNSGIT
ncbi:hypothetical protein A5906_09265 [Bradyrhizobium sacchari]|nr:hypothetical protein A5906_09265 [Bradyrhizobium sacchari]